MKSIDKKDFDKMPNPTISARFTIYIDNDFDKKEIEQAMGLKAKFCKQKSDMKVSPITNKKPKGYLTFCSKEMSTRNENDVAIPMIDYLYAQRDEIQKIQQKYDAKLCFCIEVLLNSFKDATLNLDFEYIEKLNQLHSSLEHIIEF